MKLLAKQVIGSDYFLSIGRRWKGLCETWMVWFTQANIYLHLFVSHFYNFLSPFFSLSVTLTRPSSPSFLHKMELRFFTCFSHHLFLFIPLFSLEPLTPFSLTALLIRFYEQAPMQIYYLLPHLNPSPLPFFGTESRFSRTLQAKNAQTFHSCFSTLVKRATDYTIILHICIPRSYVISLWFHYLPLH